MNILFVVNTVFFSENLGVMILSSVCKNAGHATKLLSITQHDPLEILNDFQPDVIAYSAMTPDIASFQSVDGLIQAWARGAGKSPLRIMGGAHASVFPEILDEMDLDAIVVGEGDRAILRLIDAWRSGQTLEGIPNVVPRGGSFENTPRELLQDLDSIPFPDRDLFYEARPILRHFGLRSVLVGRGCPYRCTYCHNDVFNRNFNGLGKIVRRRSVDNILEELHHVLENYGPVWQIRFGDDTFVFDLDAWTEELLTRYKKEIGLPFYCLLRSNVITEELVRALADAGCYSVSLSIESGTEQIRNTILKRGISDEKALASFALLRKYGIHTQTNSMLALPGGTFADDIQSYLFEKSARPNIGQFSIWTPFPRTSLTTYAKELECIDENYSFDNWLGDKSPLVTYAEEEKTQQLHMVYLGPLFMNLPSRFDGLFFKLIRLPATSAYRVVGNMYLLFVYFLNMFRPAVPTSPVPLLRLLLDAIRYVLSGAFSKKAEAPS